ncbi:hypothetical protein EVAR_21434_1 [Eumeta japonica]|uniref:Uncharacterized protein n=1 Tax=Eumeta variegata TaxID=151549 RepID=A0A4C1VH52_EUMVA|nr:hypothetical protein EVAR_21434_1 [Eumeta japonica]
MLVGTGADSRKQPTRAEAPGETTCIRRVCARANTLLDVSCQKDNPPPPNFHGPSNLTVYGRIVEALRDTDKSNHTTIRYDRWEILV